MWYEKIDFDENPFTTENINLIGFDNLIESITYTVNSSNILFIEGKQGSGKTALLKKAINEFKGKNKIAYIDCEKVKDLNMEKVLINSQGFVGKLFRKLPRNMIVLMDEVQNLSKINSERLKYFYDQNYVKSVIFTGINYKEINFSDSLKDRISKVIKINSLTENDVVSIIEDRLKNNNLIPGEIIKDVFKRSNKNIKEFLANCEKLCKYTVENNINKVSDEIVKEVLGDIKKEKKIDVKEKEIKIKKEETAGKKEIVKPKENIEEIDEKAEEEPKKIKIVYDDVAERYY